MGVRSVSFVALAKLSSRSAALTTAMSGPPLMSIAPPFRTRTIVTPLSARSIAMLN
ncbi:hypothetical protein [Sphingopyxis sp.]|jgi:hypothetical protein|uniref:hypothetical protein n=1 Tax=Sphingopyxis sp. TaxID=1908224 RepID=UPI003F719E87